MSRAAVERVLAAHADHDLVALARCYAPDATVWPTGWPAPVPATEWVAGVPFILESFPDLRFHPGRIAAEGDVAMVQLRMVGTNLGPLYLNDTDRLMLGTDVESLPPSGREMTIDGVVAFVCRGDLVVTERHYWLYGDTLVQLGYLDSAAAVRG